MILEQNNNIEPQFTGYIYTIKFLNKILYVGSTKDFRKRKTCHISDCYNPNSTGYNQPIYKFLRNYNIELKRDMFDVEILILNCKSKKELLQYEKQIYLENKHSVLNICNPILTEEERKAYNEAYEQSEKRKQYIKAYMKTYQQTEKYKEYNKAYMKAYNKAYYQKKKLEKNK